MENEMNYEKLTLLNFGAAWCEPCRLLETELKEVQIEMSELLTIKRVDVDKEKQITAEMGISSVPVLVLVDGDRVISQANGYMHKEAVIGWIDKHI